MKGPGGDQLDFSYNTCSGIHVKWCGDFSNVHCVVKKVEELWWREEE